MRPSRQPSTPQTVQFRKRESYLNSLKSRLRECLKSITENYEMILLRVKVENVDVLSRHNPYTQAAQDNFELRVRASNMVNACENITRLVSEIKQLLILGDFCWLENATRAGAEDREKRRIVLDSVTLRLRDELSETLFNLEERLAVTCAVPQDRHHTVSIDDTASTVSTEVGMEENQPKPEPS